MTQSKNESYGAIYIYITLAQVVYLFNCFYAICTNRLTGDRDMVKNIALFSIFTFIF